MVTLEATCTKLFLGFRKMKKKMQNTRLVSGVPPHPPKKKKKIAKSGRFDTLLFFALHRIFRYYFVLTYFRVYVYIFLFYYCRWTIILVDTTMELYMWRVGIDEYRNVLFVSDNSNNYLFNI